MKIQINSRNEIVAYVVVGDLNNGIEINDIPTNFIKSFKPNKYKYENERISLNENYTESEGQPIQPPSINLPGTDEELRSMFANMQIQIVEANTMIYEMSEQNARLAQEIVDIKSELNNTKGE